ncbi:MAG: oligosaccharide repeat unit polymerase [Bacilli bacterium]|nr:oligosaccharide repeat unit polymerase [Bacilli bacterium]
MIQLLLVILIIFLVSSIIIEKNLFNPLTIFNGIWLIVTFFAYLKLYKMIDYSNKSIVIIMIGTLCFNFGYLLTKIIHTKRNKMTNNDLETTRNSYIYNYNWTLIRILLSFAIILNILLSVKVTHLILNGVSYSSIRAMYYAYWDVEPLIKSGAIFTIFDFTSVAVLTICMPIVILSFFERKTDKISLILLIVLLVLFVYCTAGRTMILKLLISILILLFIKYKNINKSILLKILMVFVVGISLILTSTFIRNRNTKNSVPTLYSYLGSPIPIFSHMIDYVDNENIRLHGYSSFYGLYQFTEKISVLTQHKFKNSDYLDSIIIKPASTWINVFKVNHHNYNAFATMYYNLYLDYGFISVIIISILYGIFATHFYIKLKEYQNKRHIVFYIIICYGLIFSFEKFQFSSYYIYSSFVFNYLLIKKNNQNNDKLCNSNSLNNNIHE